MEVKVKKITDEELLIKACSTTIGKDSKMNLSKIYKCEHSPIRTQLFWVDLVEIPLFVASQFVRSHVGVQFFQLSKRTDRGGDDFYKQCSDISNQILKATQNINPDMSLVERDDIIDNFDTIRHEIMALPKNFDRYTPTNLSFIINAEALINISKKRLCSKASAETREIMMQIKEKIKEVDPNLYNFLVPTCVYRGGICPELKSCGFCKTDAFAKILNNYKLFFVQ